MTSKRMGKKGQANRWNKPTITWVWNSTTEKEDGKENQNKSNWISSLERKNFGKSKAKVCRINVSLSAQAVQVSNFSYYMTAYYLDANNTVRRIHLNILWLMSFLLRNNLQVAPYGNGNSTVLKKKIHTENTGFGTLIVATIYLQLIQNRYMFRSFTVLQCSHQHCVQPVASDVEVVGYL